MKSLRLTLFVSVILAFSLGNVQAQIAENLGFKLPPGQTKYTIPFEVVNNLIIVKVVLNRTLPLKFIVDTGVRTSILTDKTFSDLLNVSYSRTVVIPGAGGEQVVTAYIAPNMTINIGGVEGTGHALLVLERDFLQLKNYLGANIQGILGFELFSRFIVDINYQKKRITLYEPAEFAKMKIERKKKYYSLPITIEDTKPYCYSKITYYNGTTITTKLMVDTGASHAILLDQNSNDDIIIPHNSISSNLGRGLAGDIDGEVARVQSVDMDKFQFEDVITTFPDKEFYNQGYDKIYRNGTLGGGILSRFRAIFNFMDGYIYLKKNNKYREEFDYNMSGIIIQAKGLYLNSFEIVGIRENSAASEADIMVGDVILKINNHAASSLELDEINGVFNSKPNRNIRLELDRKGKLVRTSFKLKRTI